MEGDILGALKIVLGIKRFLFYLMGTRPMRSRGF